MGSRGRGAEVNGARQVSPQDLSLHWVCRRDGELGNSLGDILDVMRGLGDYGGERGYGEQPVLVNWMRWSCGAVSLFRSNQRFGLMTPAWGAGVTGRSGV